MRTAFFGTPHFVTHVLDALNASGQTPTVIVTQPDRPAGRGLLPRPSPVKLWADAHGVSTLLPPSIDDSVLGALKGFDLFVVAGYGKILPKELLEIPKYGTLNVHPSLLPKFRGPSPIESQILSDAKEVGVSIILLDEETDHGPILAQKSFRPGIWPPMRSELETLLWSEGGKLLADTIPPYLEGRVTPQEQEHAKATFTPKLSKDDGQVDLAADPYHNYLKYCAYEGWPGTFFFAERSGKEIRVKVSKASFTDGVFQPERVTPEGKREMPYQDFLRAYPSA